MTTLIMTNKVLMADTAAWDDRRGTSVGSVTKMARSRDRWWAAGAGDMSVVQAFLSWFQGISIGKTRGVWRNKNLPDNWPENTSILLLAPDGRTFFFEGYRMVEIEGPYIADGSGGAYAAGAMEAGKTPFDAMVIAAKLDAATGGAVDVAHAGALIKARHEIHQQIRTATASSASSGERPLLQGGGTFFRHGNTRFTTDIASKGETR